MPQGYIPSEVIPNGLDYADGIDGRPGSPSPASAVIWNQASTAVTNLIFEEDPDSPEIERAEQATLRHKFTVDWGSGLSYIATLGRGNLMQDSTGNITKILSSTLTRDKGGKAKLVIVSEGISFDSPPDGFRLEIVELNPALEKHPRYAFLPAFVRNLVNNAVSAAQVVTATEAGNILAGIKDLDPSLSTGGNWDWLTVYNAANELLLKRRIGEDTFYLPGFRIVWQTYHYLPQLVNPGGYIENPITDGGLPMYFWNPHYPDDPVDANDNIFAACATINPQLYSDLGFLDISGNTVISWLRQADSQDWERTWFRVTRTWIGAPYAHWDADLYTNQPSPYPPPPNRILS